MIRFVSRHFAALLIVTTITLLSARPATAQTFTWTGGGDANWSTGANWGGTAPTSDLNSTLLVLTGNTNLTNTLNFDLSANSLTFDAGAGAFTVSGTNTLTLGAGGITVASNANQTFNAPLALGANQVWENNGTGMFTVGGTITGGTNNLTVGGSGNTTFTGTIASLGTLTKTGTGTVQFTNPAAFGTLNTPTAYGTVTTGDVNVLGGELIVNNLRLTAPDMNANRGSGVRGANIASGAFLTVTGTLSIDPSDTVYITQVGGPGTLRLRNTSSSLTAPSIANDYGPNGGDANPWGSVIDATVDVGPGTHWIVGKTNRNDVSRYAGDLRFDGSLTGSGNLQFRGTNVNNNRNWHVVLNANNSAYTGAVFIANADLNLTNNNALSAANPITFNTVVDPATQSNGKLFLWGHNVTIGSLNDISQSGTTNSIRNGSIAGADNGGTNGNGSSVTNGVALGLDANSTLTINQTTAGVFNGVIADGPNDNPDAGSVTYRTLAIVKAGNSTLTLTGNNTYTGGTTVNAGTLLVNGQTGTNSGTGTGAVTVNGVGSQLGGNGRIAGAVTINAGGELRAGDANGVGTLTINGGVTLRGDTTTGIGARSIYRITDGSTPSSTLGGSSIGGTTTPTSNNFVLVSSGGLAFVNEEVGTLRFVIDGTGTTFAAGQRYSYRVAQAFLAPGVPQDLSQAVLSGATVQPLFSTIGFTATDFALAGDSQGFLYISFTPVPEPATVIGLAAAGLGLGQLVRRRIRRSVA